MVSCKLYGGLGNNLFQIATCIATAIKNNDTYCIPTEIHHPHDKGQKVFYSPNIHYCNPGVITETIYKEPSFEYTEIPKPISNNILLDGYFQSEKYFAEYREEILKAFNLGWKKLEGVVSVQVRRGDYLKYPTIHPVVTKEYIESAMALFPNKMFAFFSDDEKWVLDNFGHREDCYFASSWDEVRDLVEGSCCEHNISSNSSYGWWMYWLNQNPDKKGVFPRTWFGESMNHNTKDLYPENAIIL